MVEYSPYYTGAEQIMRESPDIEARKLGLIDTAKALTEKGYTLPNYVLAGLTQDQKDAFALQREGIGSFQPFLTQAQQAGTTGLGTTAQAISQLGQFNAKAIKLSGLQIKVKRQTRIRNRDLEKRASRKDMKKEWL